MRKLVKHAGRMVIVLLLGGFLGATLVRIAPGYGVDEEELDSRLSQGSLQALRQSQEPDRNLASFYLRYWAQLLHGNFGFSVALHEPVRQLLAERFPETLKSIGMGLVLGWMFGLGLATTW